MIHCLVATAAAVLAAAALMTGCGQKSGSTAEADNKLTVYLWDVDLLKNITPYIYDQLPEKDIEFISGNNDTDLYSYLAENGELPDIITVRRFSGTDARDLKPYLMDFSAYDVVSEYSSYALQYYKNSDGEINWLPVCGIPQTIIANKTLFDSLGIELPQNYREYAKACQIFHDNGIKPYALDLAEDWSSHEMIQAGGIGELTGLDGIAWRNSAESAEDDIPFDDAMWKRIFSETAVLLKDTHFTKADLELDTSAAMQLFTDGKAAMFHGSPVNFRQCQELMDAELVRLPYFSQTSEEGFIYMTPSLHIAFNKELENNTDKLETAIKVLECMISEEGQRLIADGGSVISFNMGVDSITDDMAGLEDEIYNNDYYIRYAAQKSFAASKEAVSGLLTGTMDADDAYEAFRSAINSSPAAEDDTAVSFDKTYSLALNDRGGRDAASVILTSVRKAIGADFALAPYYYFTSSIYKGACTDKRLGLMIGNRPSTTPLYLESLSGAQLRELAELYLSDSYGIFYPENKYELPIASGMKLIAEKKDNGFVLKDILADGKALDDKKEYSVILTEGSMDILNKMLPDHELKPCGGTTLSAEWLKAAGSREGIAEPEDYIEIR